MYCRRLTPEPHRRCARFPVSIENQKTKHQHRVMRYRHSLSVRYQNQVIERWRQPRSLDPSRSRNEAVVRQRQNLANSETK